MSSHPLPDTPEALAAERLAALRELREIAMGLARVAGAQARAALEAGAAVEAEAAGDEAAEAAPRRAADPVMRFVRLSRTVRQTIALEIRVAEEGSGGRSAEARWRQKGSVADVAGLIIKTQAPEARRTALLGLLDARIEAQAELEPEFETLPLGVLVARICRELGVTPNWSLWAETDWAQAEAEAQVPGSPFRRIPFGSSARGAPPRRPAVRSRAPLAAGPAP